MEDLFDPSTVEELKQRITRMTPDAQRQWGKMNPAQALAHCSVAMELATGERRPRRMLIGRVLGPLVKSKAFRNGEPMRRNSPTVPGFAVTDQRHLDTERERLIAIVDRFARGGPEGCTTHPHSFFGRLTPQEWSQWMYKHLDHHLRQFGL